MSTSLGGPNHARFRCRRDARAGHAYALCAGDRPRRRGQARQRVGSTLRDATGGQGPIPSTLRAGYEAVTNLSYAPMDALELLTRARAAVRHGSADHAYPWLRRFDGATGLAPEPGATPRRTPAGVLLDERSGQ